LIIVAVGGGFLGFIWTRYRKIWLEGILLLFYYSNVQLLRGTLLDVRDSSTIGCWYFPLFQP